MAVGKGRKAKRMAVVHEPGGKPVGCSADGHDGDRATGEREAAPKGKRAGTWVEVAARLSDLDQPGNPVCLVEVDCDGAPDSWQGMYGGAVIHKGSGWTARTQDGATHAL